jgi:diacylglycerol kinase family enzyme
MPEPAASAILGTERRWPVLEAGDPRHGRARPLVVVVNPNVTHPVGSRQLHSVLHVLRESGADVEVATTPDEKELAQLGEAFEGSRFVLVGGDGSVHAAAAALPAASEIALVPTGSANNVAHSVGIPLDPLAAAQLAAVGVAHPLDLVEARANGRSCRIVEGVSVGFLAQARARYRQTSSGHLLSGAAAGIRALGRFHPLAVRVHHEPFDEELVLAQLFVANLPLYAFGLHVAPHADLGDGLLDLVGLEAADRRAVLGMLAALKRGHYLGRPGVHLWRARSARIRTHGASPVIGDSVDLGTGPVELVALPGALRLVRPG